MNSNFFLFLIVLVSIFSCAQKNKEVKEVILSVTEDTIKTLDTDTFRTVSSVFTPPENCIRSKTKDSSYAAYLRDLPLKPKGTLVTLFNGDKKQNYGVYAAVVDLPIGKKNLHQCADAVMRLRAEYFSVPVTILFDRALY